VVYGTGTSVEPRIIFCNGRFEPDRSTGTTFLRVTVKTHIIPKTISNRSLCIPVFALVQLQEPPPLSWGRQPKPRCCALALRKVGQTPSYYTGNLLGTNTYSRRPTHTSRRCFYFCTFVDQGYLRKSTFRFRYFQHSLEIVSASWQFALACTTQRHVHYTMLNIYKRTPN